MAAITLTNSNVNSGTAVTLYGAKLTYGWKSLTVNKPIQQYFGKSEVQFNGWENPIINLTFIIRPNDNGTNVMSWELWNDFIRQKPTSSNQTTLNITTGGLTSNGISGSTAVFSSYALDTTTTGVQNIPVVIKSASVNIDPSDSNNGYFWFVNAQLIETK